MWWKEPVHVGLFVSPQFCNAKQVGVFALRKDKDGRQTNMHKAKKLNHCLKDRRNFAMIRKGPLQSKLEVPFIYPVHVACVCPPCPRMRMVPCTVLASPYGSRNSKFSVNIHRFWLLPASGNSAEFS